MHALSQVQPRRLFRALDDEELQDLYDWASGAGLGDAASRFATGGPRPALRRRWTSPPRSPNDSWRKRDDDRCQSLRCHQRPDHPTTRSSPGSRGGSSKDPENLQLLCRSCNSRKGTKRGPSTAPITKTMRTTEKSTHPRRPGSPMSLPGPSRRIVVPAPERVPANAPRAAAPGRAAPQTRAGRAAASRRARGHDRPAVRPGRRVSHLADASCSLVAGAVLGTEAMAVGRRAGSLRSMESSTDSRCQSGAGASGTCPCGLYAYTRWNP